MNILFYNDSKNKNRTKNNFGGNGKSFIKKLKKFHSCQNLILGKYPTGHGLLLPIQRDFEIDNHHIIEEKGKKEKKNKIKKEINLIAQNVKKKIKEKNKIEQKNTTNIITNIINNNKKEEEKKEIMDSKEKEEIKEKENKGC